MVVLAGCHAKERCNQTCFGKVAVYKTRKGSQIKGNTLSSSDTIISYPYDYRISSIPVHYLTNTGTCGDRSMSLLSFYVTIKPGVN